MTDRWQKFSGLAVEPRQLEALAARCDEFLVHGVDVEGKQLGGTRVEWMFPFASQRPDRSFCAHLARSSFPGMQRVSASGTLLSKSRADAGIDEELVAMLGRHAPLPVTYAGGARTLVR